MKSAEVFVRTVHGLCGGCVSLSLCVCFSRLRRGTGLVLLCQGRWCVSENDIDFRMLAADGGWHNSPQTDAYLHGLSPRIKGQFIALDTPETLDALSNKIDKCLVDSDREIYSRPVSPVP